MCLFQYCSSYIFIIPYVHNTSFLIFFSPHKPIRISFLHQHASLLGLLSLRCILGIKDRRGRGTQRNEKRPLSATVLYINCVHCLISNVLAQRLMSFCRPLWLLMILCVLWRFFSSGCAGFSSWVYLCGKYWHCVELLFFEMLKSKDPLCVLLHHQQVNRANLRLSHHTLMPFLGLPILLALFCFFRIYSAASSPGDTLAE